MRKTISIVWAAGSEGYHLERAMKKFPESEVLDELAQQVQAAGMTSSYTDAMRRAVEIVDYHRCVQRGTTVCKLAHVQLQRDEEQQRRMTLAR
ncbi:MAG: hypothetical protein WAV95_16965 [Azonexus sp.]